MKFAINYSEAAESLVEQGQIKVDLFKCPDWSWLVSKVSRIVPVSVHFNLQIGNRSLAYADWQAIDQLYGSSRTLYVNLHLEPERKHHPDIPIDSDDPLDQEKIVERTLREMQPILKRYSAEQVIIENVIYRRPGGKVLKAGVLPNVFHKIFDEVNCGFLLDISHARISARAMGMEEREYISNLPVHRLREVHFTGLHPINGKLVDHLPVLEEDWLILDWVLEEIRAGKFSRPWLFAFEYGGLGEKFADRTDPEVISNQVPLLYQKIQSV